MMEVVVTTGAIKRAKLQSNRHHQQINTQFFYRPDALLCRQRVTAMKEMTLWKRPNIHLMGLTFF